MDIRILSRVQIQNPEYRVRFDGGCFPNPLGHASCACLITRGDRTVYQESKYLGFGAGMTNNVAEFAGLLMAIEWLVANAAASATIEVIGDSAIVIRRMQTRTLPSGVCRGKAAECLIAVRRLGAVAFRWEGRESNDICDGMCDREIERARSTPNFGVAG